MTRKSILYYSNNKVLILNNSNIIYYSISDIISTSDWSHYFNVLGT